MTVPEPDAAPPAADDALAQGPATLSMPAVVDAETVIDLALRVGEVHLAAGAAAGDATAVVEKVLNAYGLMGSVVDVTYTAITLSAVHPVSGATHTQVRVVRTRGRDYQRLVGVTRLVDQITADMTPLRDARAQLRAITDAHHPYRHGTSILSTGLLAASAAVVFGASIAGAGVSGLVGAVIFALTRALVTRRIPEVLAQVAGAAIAVAAAAAVTATPLHISPSVVVVSGIITLLAGMVFVGAVTDALTGYYVTASARLIETVLLTGGVIAGAQLGLELIAQTGIRFSADAGLPAAHPWWVSATAAGVSAAAFAHACYAPKRTLAMVAVSGAVAQAITLTVASTGMSYAWALAAGAAAMSWLAHVSAGWTRTPPLLCTTAALIPLLPGLAIYRGLFDLAGESNLAGLLTLFSAATAAGALAVGVLVGELAAGWRPRPPGRPGRFKASPRR